MHLGKPVCSWDACSFTKYKLLSNLKINNKEI